MAFLCLACGLVFTLLYKYFYMIPLVIFALLLLWLYSFKPVRLSYRGGGEILQTLGTALVLPLLGFYAQSGILASFPWEILLAVVPTSFACAVATAVPDAPADAEYNKNTVPVAIGLNRAKALIIVLNVISIILYYLLTEPFKNSLLSVLFFALPPLSVILSLVFIKAKPGTPSVTVFGLSAILTTISVIGGMAFNFLGF